MENKALCTTCKKYRIKDHKLGLCGYCLRKKVSGGKKSSKSSPSVESYYHQASKAILASWLIEKGYEVAYEFPICNPQLHDAAAIPWHTVKKFKYDGDGSHHHHHHHHHSPFFASDKLHIQPSREWCKEQGYTPAVIYDLVAIKDGEVRIAYEIYHRHKCDKRKIAIIHQMKEKSTATYKVHEISSRWILGQIERPKKIRAMRSF